VNQYFLDSQNQYFSAAIEAANIKTGAGLLWSINVLNVNAAARYLYLFDATTSTGTMIVAPQLVGIGATVNLIFPMAKKFATALRFASSSGAAGTFTAAGTADFIVTCSFD